VGRCDEWGRTTMWDGATNGVAPREHKLRTWAPHCSVIEAFALCHLEAVDGPRGATAATPQFASSTAMRLAVTGSLGP
jgi:hypothetical protein